MEFGVVPKVIENDLGIFLSYLHPLLLGHLYFFLTTVLLTSGKVYLR